MKKILYSALTLILGLVLSSSGCTHDTIDPALFDEGVEINGVIWATRNVGEFGKFVANETDAGMFYQWNRKTGWSASVTPVPSGAVWNSTGDEGATAWADANNPCPTGWTFPTLSQTESLKGVTTSWRSDPKGRVFGDGVKVLFIPIVGGEVTGSGTFNVRLNDCHYWTSDEDGTYAVKTLYISNSYAFFDGGGSSTKNYGLPIRCVKK